MVQRQKILIPSGLRIKNIDFSWSERLCNLQESQKLEKTKKKYIMVLVGPDERPRKSDPPTTSREMGVGGG